MSMGGPRRTAEAEVLTDKADIYQTWRAGGAVIRLTPR